MHEKDVIKGIKSTDIELNELLNIVNAVSQVYPMIVLANLTKNTYSMIKNESFLYNEVINYGRYDDLIDDNAENIHANYQRLFHECFSREHLIKSFSGGKTEVYAEIYQKSNDGKYQWVSVHVIRIEDDNGDIKHICLNRALDGIVEVHGNRR